MDVFVFCVCLRFATAMFYLYSIQPNPTYISLKINTQSCGCALCFREACAFLQISQCIADANPSYRSTTNHWLGMATMGRAKRDEEKTQHGEN